MEKTPQTMDRKNLQNKVQFIVNPPNVKVKRGLYPNEKRLGVENSPSLFDVKYFRE
ncbi:hypothetical protein GWK17_00710 [Bacillus selenatarsenatis]|uniref:Uncharacterized protein n=1 Tax=Mesobacillus selenatarsenatis TaxID=388741 RepID=A0A846TCN8_9BACI|nr:hypothetical protein [Mesobacillus selenatarsenatis]